MMMMMTAATVMTLATTDLRQLLSAGADR